MYRDTIYNFQLDKNKYLINQFINLLTILQFHISFGNWLDSLTYYQIYNCFKI